MSPQLECVERIRSCIKNPRTRGAMGFLAEMDIFNKLEAAKVPFVRSYEGANVDGVFVCGDREEIEAFNHRFEADDSYSKWKWAMEEEQVKLITFDVKYVSLRASRTKKQDYAFTEINLTHANEKSEIYLLCFEGWANYTAVVPKHVWERASNFSHGIDPLMVKIPAWCFGFMVHDDDLRDAIFQMVEASLDTNLTVRNPTLDISLTGYSPRLTQERPIAPTLGGQARARLSYNAVTWLWAAIAHSKSQAKIHFNPLAPLICDFLLEIPEYSEALRIEAKSTLALGKSQTVQFETSEDRSPFAPARQWHFAIVQAGANNPTFLCFGRHEVRHDWQDRKYWKYHDYQEFLIEGVEELIRHIRHNYRKAVDKVRETTAFAETHHIDMKYLITSNAADRIREILDTPEGELKSADLVYHVPGLPWIAEELNKQCSRARRGICFALDDGHPISSHVMVDYSWTVREAESYDSEKILPILPFSRDAIELPCVPLDFEDLSGARHGRPIGMREYYWTQPVVPQQFLLIGSILRSQDLTPITVHTPSTYLMLPSQWLSRMLTEPRSPVSSKAYDGKDFFRHVLQETNAANPELWTADRTEVVPMLQGSVLLTNQSVNPLEHLVDLADGSLRKQILEFFEDNGQMSIRGFQQTTPNPSVPKPVYRCTLRYMHQVAWDYGVKRKPWRETDKSVIAD